MNVGRSILAAVFFGSALAQAQDLPKESAAAGLGRRGVHRRLFRWTTFSARKAARSRRLCERLAGEAHDKGENAVVDDLKAN